MDIFNKKALADAKELIVSLQKQLGDVREAKAHLYDTLMREFVTLQDQVKEQNAIISAQTLALEEANLRLKEKEVELDVLKIEHDKLLELSTKTDKENSVTIAISDDFAKITPIFRWKSDCPEHLFQAGYIQDRDITNPIAIQLALATAAFDGLETLLDNFSPVPTSVE